MKIVFLSLVSIAAFDILGFFSMILGPGYADVGIIFLYGIFSIAYIIFQKKTLKLSLKMAFAVAYIPIILELSGLFFLSSYLIRKGQDERLNRSINSRKLLLNNVTFYNPNFYVKKLGNATIALIADTPFLISTSFQYIYFKDTFTINLDNRRFFNEWSIPGCIGESPSYELVNVNSSKPIDNDSRMYNAGKYIFRAMFKYQDTPSCMKSNFDIFINKEFNIMSYQTEGMLDSNQKVFKSFTVDSIN